jgi:hypothetical protein
MVQIDSSETSIINQPLLLNNAEDGIIQVNAAEGYDLAKLSWLSCCITLHNIIVPTAKMLSSSMVLWRIQDGSNMIGTICV